MSSITFLLDRSGSMESCWDDVLGGFNAFIKDQDSNATMTLVQFDHEYTVPYENLKMSEVQPLTRETYKPRGSTALLDALGYMGANQDAFAEAGSMGIAAGHTMNYDSSRTPEAMHRLSQTVSSIGSN